MTTLYKKSATGAMMQWSVEIGVFGLEIEFGQVGGSMQEVGVSIEENQSGRDWETQAILELDARVARQIDKGYSGDIEKAKLGATNALDMPMPMLAKPYKENILFPTTCYVQMKYDGNRCLITKQNGIVFAYSRNGKVIKSIDHILQAAEGIEEGDILDGELYHHGTPLQTIRSWISRGQADSNKLVYMCYDMIIKASFSRRLEALKSLNLGYPIKIAETFLLGGIELEPEPILSRLNHAIKQGYEGLIIRYPHLPYEDGKRSKSLVKVKAWQDAEFKVKKVSVNDDGWGILHMESGGKVFKSTAPGTHSEKRLVANFPDKFIGRNVTIQYANMTKDGVPFHPVAIAWRDSSD